MYERYRSNIDGCWVVRIGRLWIRVWPGPRPLCYAYRFSAGWCLGLGYWKCTWISNDEVYQLMRSFSRADE